MFGLKPNFSRRDVKYIIALVVFYLMVGTGGCSSFNQLTPKQQAAILNDSFAIAENAITTAVSTGIISPSENVRLIRPAILGARASLDSLTAAVSKVPPDPAWQQYMNEVTAALPSILLYAKTAQARASTQPVSVPGTTSPVLVPKP